jgi:hypothetical protein
MRRAISSLIHRLGGIAILLAMIGSAWAAPIAAAAGPPPGRWERLRALELRVAKVAYRMSLANRALCRGAIAPLPGFVLHDIGQYDPADRPEAARSFGLGSGIGVMAIVPGSPAERSGLAADDELVRVNRRSLRVTATAADAGSTRAPVEFAERVLAEEMAKGPVILGVTGPRGVRDLRFTADSGCASAVELATDAASNAWADGERVVISVGILAHCASDGDLALVIGHELAHNLLHHGRRRAGAQSAAPRRPSRTGLAASRKREEEADGLGVRLASRAGYDLGDAPSFLAGLLHSEAGDRAQTHPETARRLALLRAEIAAAGSKAAA